MKQSTLSAAVATSVLLLSAAAQADDVKGGARADFEADELIVPCVAIEGYSEAADGTFFDIVFDRRGKSFNYELKLAEPEDAAMCERIANYAIFIDDDPEDDAEDEEDGGPGQGMGPGQDQGSQELALSANIFASCEVRVSGEEQTRSKIKVKAKDLEPGDFYAVVTSGDNSLQSENKTIEDDEVEFEFSSDGDDVLEGSEAIEAGFIMDESVTAEVFDAATDEVVLSETVSCIVKEVTTVDDEEEEGDEEV